MANLSNINNKFLVTTTGEVLIGQTANDGNRLQITGADGASYIYLKTDVATTGGRIGFNSDDLRVFNQQASGELQLGTAGTSRVRISNSLVVFPTITELRGDISTKFAIGNMGGASSQMMVSSRGFITFNTSNTGSALDATERMRINSAGTIIGTGTYTASGSVKIFEAQRLGGAVKSDWDYHDSSPIRMSIGTSTSHNFAIKTADTPRLTISSGGNVGVGVVPGAVVAGNIRLDVGTLGCGITSRQNFETVITANADYGTATTTGKPATRFYMTNGGNFQFETAPPEDAGVALTFTPRMVITEAVAIGTLTPTARLDVLTNSATGTNDIDRHVRFRADNGEQRFNFFVGRSGNSSNLQMYDSSEVVKVVLNTSDNSYFNGGNLGIGTTSPAAPLTIQANFTLNGGYTNSNWAKYIFLDSANTGGGGIIWTKQSSAYNRAIVNNQGKMEFGRSTADNASAAWLSDLSIDAVGDTTFGGNIFIASTSDGIFLGGTGSTSVLKKFVGNQGGGGAVWTPTVTTSQGTSPTITSSSGYYQQIGNVVTVSFEFTMSNPTAGAGSVIINNLPIAIADADHVSGCGVIGDLGKTINVRHYTATNQIAMNFYDGNYCGTAFRTVGTVTYWAAT